MSLTRHLDNKNSPIHEFLRTRFPDVRTFLKDARSQVRNADTIRPYGNIPWGTIGTALDYRLRYYFAVTPCSELIAYEGARRLTDAQNIDIVNTQLDYKHLGGDEIRFFDKVTGKRVGGYFPDIDGAYSVPGLDHDLLSLGQRIKETGIDLQSNSTIPLGREYDDFFEKLEELTGRCNPAARRLIEVEEDELNRHCIVLALLEEVVRAGLRPNSQLAVGEFADAESLISIAQPHWLDDLRELSWKFYDEFNHLLTRAHVVNPTFDGSVDVRGADADLIVDGTLIEIKTSVKQEIQSDWLWQLLGYVLLDYSDFHRIHSIGLYMSRQGILFQWDLDEAVGVLRSGNSISIEQLRGQFRKIARSVGVS